MSAVEWLEEQLDYLSIEELKTQIIIAKELEEKQRDEFAIGFAEHIQNIGFNKLTQKGYDNKTVMWFSNDKGIGVTTNELLDSYKRNL